LALLGERGKGVGIRHEAGQCKWKCATQRGIQSGATKRQDCQTDDRPFNWTLAGLSLDDWLFHDGHDGIADGHVPLPAVFALKAFVNGCVNILPRFNNSENRQRNRRTKKRKSQNEK